MPPILIIMDRDPRGGRVRLANANCYCIHNVDYSIDIAVFPTYALYAQMGTTNRMFAIKTCVAHGRRVVIIRTNKIVHFNRKKTRRGRPVVHVSMIENL